MGTRTDIFTPTFITAMFTKARKRKPPKCPLMDEWVGKMSSIHTVEHYSAIKRKEVMPFAETWMDLKAVTQSEENQKEKNKCRILTHTSGI